MNSTSVASSPQTLRHGFGHVGRNETTINGSSVRVHRTIDLHPVDMQIKLPRGEWFPWQKTSDDRLEFDAEFSAQTLGSLDELTSRLRTLVAEGLHDDLSHPDVLLFKDVYVELIRASAEAHRQGCRMGLLDPTNVIYAIAADRTRVFLPDAGFIWTGGVYVPPHLTQARWGWDESQTRAMVRLWDPHPTMIDAETKGSPHDEAVALARMLAWVLSGSVPIEKRKLIPGDQGSVVYRCWQTLNPLVAPDSKVADASTLAGAMSRAPLWKAFVKEIPYREPEPPRKRLPWVIIGLIALLCAGLGAVYHFRTELVHTFNGPPPLPATNVCELCTSPGDFYDELVRLDQPDSSYSQLSDVFSNGVVNGDQVSLWIATTQFDSSQRAEFVDVESRHFGYVADLLAKQSQALLRLRSLEQAAVSQADRDSQSDCVAKLAGELRAWIEHTDELINWSEYFSRGLDRNVIQKVVNVAAEFKTSFPDYLPLEKDAWPEHLSQYVLQTEAQRAATASP